MNSLMARIFNWMKLGQSPIDRSFKGKDRSLAHRRRKRNAVARRRKLRDIAYESRKKNRERGAA
jgi:hypothetical protein